MMGLLTDAPPLRRRGKNRVPTPCIANYRFSFIHPEMGIISIRNAVMSDVSVLRETLYKPYFCRRIGSIGRRLPVRRSYGGSMCPSEQELADCIGCSTILLVSSLREEGETIIAAITLFKADIQSDLKRALERSADDGSDTVRIDRFAAFEYVDGFDRRPIVIGKEVLVKLLNDAKRKQGVILLVRNVIVDAAFRKTDILKFISVKIVRILKYVKRCSHIIYENSPGGITSAGNDGAGGIICREILKGTELGCREKAADGIDSTVTQDQLWVSSCETIFDIPPKRGRLRAVPHITVQELSRSGRQAASVRS